MLSAFAAAFRTPDLRRKLFFTLGIIGIFRIGSVIPAPGVSYAAVQFCVDSVQDNSIYGLINLFSGGALLQLSIFALGIMPYITASIIIQLLTVVIPRLESLKKEGQAGQARITQYTRYLTVGLAVLQSTTIITLARTPGRLFQGCNEQLLPNQSIQMLLTIVVVMTAGASLIFWLGELITDRGVGNGMSILIFSSIISTFPGQLSSIFTIDGSLKFILVLLVIGVTIAGVVFVEQAQRRIPVQYAKRQVGRKSYGGTSTYLPIKVNQAGVIPVIFASSLLYLPSLIVQLTGSQAAWAQWVATYMDPGRSGYLTLNFLLIMFFAYFYVSITFNPEETADNMKQYGGFIPGIRAGKPTAEYLAYVLNRITLPGSLYLATIATLPYLAFEALGVGTRFAFGGTSILIIVGVGLDTVKQIESQLQQRNYEGFLK
ncbi:MAG: preprotein translocase subunit SecY [Candidatus Nanopelagicales bacterium]|jgi:preprotein translocase subunit SecY|nr:preprotein translocase subunit SecY [Candidatus Nanopelagicales bacterium]MDP4666420.1 preprotein translocase subunit SecY [Candidatus Nanopelagicales bacterium]MDP4896041.1 preprotein translocase subunit SecY [Candidatus Nanopelagicales bacterium]MDP5050123.1 preprotein translocase subunit SecY [Candidatus Nanopelagicales bacterium]